MAGSDLDTELRRAANETVESILNEARGQSERVVSESERAIEDRRKELTERKEAEYGKDARRAIAAERHSALRAVLMARTQLVDKVLERARALLPDASTDERYLASLFAELAEALKFVDDDDATVRCSPALEAAVQKALSDRTRVRVEADDEIGIGFVVVGGSESVRVDGQLETWIDRMASSLAIEIHARLREL
jgi:V/A-type H+-transporting ATPase subunit E